MGWSAELWNIEVLYQKQAGNKFNDLLETLATLECSSLGEVMKEPQESATWKIYFTKHNKRKSLYNSCTRNFRHQLFCSMDVL